MGYLSFNEIQPQTQRGLDSKLMVERDVFRLPQEGSGTHNLILTITDGSLVMAAQVRVVCS